MRLVSRISGGVRWIVSLGVGSLLAATAAGVAAAAQDRGADAEPVVLSWVGTTSHAWGAWVPAGATVEDWVEQAIALCTGDEICEVNVFEGPELVTHEIPVPEANRPGLKWVFLYRQDETPSVVVEEAHAEPGREPRTWTFDP
ncbi:MAG: hypothetical protein OXH75_15465 [Acidobacteria bacterium]|nr:hypothetical protein [Acidobacteriota bacterium]